MKIYKNKNQESAKFAGTDIGIHSKNDRFQALPGLLCLLTEFGKPFKIFVDNIYLTIKVLPA